MKDIYILNDKKINGVNNLSVFNIKYIEQNIDFKKYDALIFTSKYALHSINSFTNIWKKIPSFVIAPQTAEVVTKLTGNLEFTGKTNNGNEFALELISLLQNKTVLYLRGSKIVSNLVTILNDNDIKCDELIAYKSVCKELSEEISLPKDSTIIFSSPSTIKCFLNNFSWKESYTAISIGKTTATYFPEYINPIISKTTSLEDCVKNLMEE
jgi:uroporphyrinogen-III synthase